MTATPRKILIIGAGPTGLTCALELYRRGHSCRIIDRKPAMSTLSRAIGINPRSLSLMEACGVTEKLIAEGIKMRMLEIHDGNGRAMGHIKLDRLPRPYNFLLALPQDKTERIMHESLQAYGGTVEYQTSLASLRLENDRAVVRLAKNDVEAEDIFDLIVAADGSRSVVRESLGIEFPGFNYENLWGLSDFESHDLPYANNHAHLFLRDEGVLGVLIAIGEHRFRAVSNTDNALSEIPGSYMVDKTINANAFHIGVRQAVTYQKGCVYLAGDAAHIHSPAGGRGMNLGIEDACDLARRISEGGLEHYTRDRHPVGAKVLVLSEQLVRVASIKSPLGKMLRRIMIRLITSLPPLQGPLIRRIAGVS